MGAMSIKHNKNSSERIMGLLALVVIILGILILVSFVWLSGITTWMTTVGFALLGYLFVSMILSLVLRPKENNKRITTIIFRIANWNIQAFGLLVALVLPATLLLMGLLFIILIPFAVIMLVLKLLAVVIFVDYHTILFISMSIGSIISAYYSKPLFFIISKFLTMNGHRYEIHFKRMVEYVYQPANLQFVVYFLYVVYLLCSTIYRFQTKGQLLWGQETGLAVLESFLVFIAFSNMKIRSRSTDFKLSELFNIMVAMWTTHDNIEDEQDGNE